MQSDLPRKDHYQGACYIVSLKYAAGLGKEFKLTGDRLRDHGYTVKYLTSARYSWLFDANRDSSLFLTRSANVTEMIVDTAVFPILSMPKLLLSFALHPPKMLLLYNPHPLNIALAALARVTCRKGICLLYLHEPSTGSKPAPDLSSYLYRFATQASQAVLVRLANHVAVPSPNANLVLRHSFPRISAKVHTCPLLIPDTGHEGGTQPREHVSMVGRVFPDGRVEAFLALVERVAESGEGFRFRIVTPSNISGYVKGLSKRALACLDVISRPDLSDREIDTYLRSSIAVLAMHTQGAQSGVTPVALMNGTPIVARDLPMFSQFVTHRHNGYLVARDSSLDDWMAAIRYVRANLSVLSKNARSTYEAIFHEEHWERHFSWLLEDLRQGGGG